MTSRTIDIHCYACGKYMHSELPESSWDKKWIKKHFCNKPKCKEAEAFDVLRGPEPKPEVDMKSFNELVANIKAGKLGL